MGEEMTLKTINQRMQKTFNQTPRSLEECTLWGKANLRTRDDERNAPEEGETDDEFKWWVF